MRNRVLNRFSRFLFALTAGGLLTLAAPALAQSTAVAGCQDAVTQAEMNVCAYEEFLVAQAEMADRLATLQAAFSAEQRAGLRRVQRAWLGFRTEACTFESRGVGVGSAQAMLQWRCTARMTRERTAALALVTDCPQGELACVRPAAAGAPR